ncbi:protein rep [Lactococcus lactis]|uniref:protein rep n=2 Tax=Lactococcus lactis TaxID=1358 RepID=UPI00288FE61D|nr:protein rep [Lactococcus lactis]MDT2893378.1 protein rep [Lactococcus lactis]
MKEYFQGDEFKDISKNGKDRKWKERKQKNLKLANIFDLLNYPSNFVSNIHSCAEHLSFKRASDGSLRLFQMYTCKNKQCAICSWRRSMKYQVQISKIVEEAIIRKPKGRFLFLTLTVKNVVGENLNHELSKLTEAFRRLMMYKKVSKNMIGFLRATEVTRNELMDTYHPHIHVLLFVSPTYFKNKENYISQDEWTDLWKKSAKLDYYPIVDVRAIKPKNEKTSDIRSAILETAKYPVKPMELTVESAKVVDDLQKGLYRKRQIAFGGLFKQIKKELELDDIENGDLINLGDEESPISDGEVISVLWNHERQNYYVR